MLVQLRDLGLNSVEIKDGNQADREVHIGGS